ncbi:ABC transporter ATP-binding protein [Comamonas thiooxydans]|uniref:ABC transporter ATP-binding protein n=1 Tax=Comamonas thiooxydans TaxID=363952 RepID=UPI0005F7821D|nr:ABC transporter ATP-binding protein [Comamonas thiooxydans]CUB01842.1 amino acid/amide ABC transporter ATP-binding protein 1, HAAT family (TC 3.A.1.4.-) [Comamonas thiooxydans]
MNQKIPTLQLDNVGKRFGGLPAVDGLSLSAPAGAITGLIGPNGAGKTTAINLIMGILKLTSGRILFNGKDVSTLEAADLARLGMARTFQNIRLVADGTVLDNVLSGFHIHQRTGFWANLLGLPYAHTEQAQHRAQAQALLEQFGMAHLAGHRAGTLSYGHQRRIEMMRALAMKPQLLLLDEPVAGMNDTEAAELGHIFSQVAASGVAILLVEHNMRFVTQICSRLYVSASGRLIAQGTPETVLANPVVIEAYLGS